MDIYSGASTPVIWLEGIIGAGKTTFMKEVGSRLGYKLLEEPVEENFYLNSFYSDPAKYAFSMQIYLLHHRFTMKQIAMFEAARGIEHGIMLDRSLAGDAVFEQMLYEDDLICDLDHKCYRYCYDVMSRTIQFPTLVVYLSVTPEVAYGRILSRGRSAETAISLEYLTKLHSGYEQLICTMESGRTAWGRGLRVLRLDVNKPIPEIAGGWDFYAGIIDDAVNF